MAKRNGKGNGHTTTLKRSGNRLTASRAEPITDRLPVLKTYKIYIGGKFPRTESGRYYLLKGADDRPIANICDCSRKDFRDSVVAARAAQPGWAKRSAFNRSQILYRIAEMMEGRSQQFVYELVEQGVEVTQARTEVLASIDRFLYYAGWCDKYQQIFSSVNPVASSHFNFSVLEPTGVVSILSPNDSGLMGLVSTIAPAITGGNTCIALASTDMPLCAVTLSEVLATSDLPGGVVNILTGRRSELIEHFASHMDVNACIYCGNDKEERTTVRARSAGNVKRAIVYDRADWISPEAQNPYLILDTQEVKTTWHPVGI